MDWEDTDSYATMDIDALMDGIISSFGNVGVFVIPTLSLEKELAG
jgi:hypothetical protein